MTNPRILLINVNACPFTKVYPLGLDYLASTLEDRNYPVDKLDLALIPENLQLSTVKKAIASFEYLAICLGIRNLSDELYHGKNYLLEIIKLAKFIRRVITEKRLKALLILGGAGFSLIPQTILDKTRADFGVIGEGEKTLPLLLEKIKKGEIISEKIITEPFTDLSRVQYRRGTWGHLHKYLKIGSSGNLQTKRGCPMRCLYCEYPAIEGQHFRFRNPEIVAEEFLQLEDLGFPKIYFVDATFNNPPTQAKQILKALIKAGTSRPWTGFFNPKFIDQELLELIKATHGDQPLKITIESGSNKILTNLGKNFARDDIETAIKLCRKNNLNFSFTVLFGSPGETKETVAETCNLVRKAKPFSVSVSIGIFIHPQTPLGISTKGKLWRQETDLLNPVVFPCRFDKIRGWIDKELASSRIFFNPVFLDKAGLPSENRGRLK